MKPTEDDDEIDLRELFSALWDGKLTIAFVTALSALISVSVALYLPNKYTSEALLAPRAEGGAGGGLGATCFSIRRLGKSRWHQCRRARRER